MHICSPLGTLSIGVKKIHEIKNFYFSKKKSPDGIPLIFFWKKKNFFFSEFFFYQSIAYLKASKRANLQLSTRNGSSCTPFSKKLRKIKIFFFVTGGSPPPGGVSGGSGMIFVFFTYSGGFSLATDEFSSF